MRLFLRALSPSILCMESDFLAPGQGAFATVNTAESVYHLVLAVHRYWKKHFNSELVKQFKLED